MFGIERQSIERGPLVLALLFRLLEMRDPFPRIDFTFGGGQYRRVRHNQPSIPYGPGTTLAANRRL